MKHTQLKNHIKGSFLKEQYLEAFLVQSAYIESLLKLYLDFSYWKAAGGIKMSENSILSVMYKKIQRYGLNELTVFLHSAKLISEDQKKILNSYRKKRNSILHDLIKEMIAKETLENELKEVCEIGNKIINSSEFAKIVSLVDLIEKKDREKEKSTKLEGSAEEPQKT